MKKKTSTNTSGEFYLGYSRQELLDVSWYQLLHWDFMREAQSKHRLSKILTTPFYCPYSNNWLPKSPLVEIVTSLKKRNAFIYLLYFVIFFKTNSHSVGARSVLHFTCPAPETQRHLALDSLRPPGIFEFKLMGFCQP